jgi:hypothetical protein
MLSVFMLSFFMLSVFILSVVIQNVVMLSVVAPRRINFCSLKPEFLFQTAFSGIENCGTFSVATSTINNCKNVLFHYISGYHWQLIYFYLLYIT